MNNLNARFFGFPVIEIDGSPIKIGRRKTLALLVYLILNDPAAVHGRESLAALFWPELGQAEAGASLRHALWELHSFLGDRRLDKEGQVVRACLEKEDKVDVLEFQALVHKGIQANQKDPYGQILTLLEAVALYRANFLSGFTLRDCPEFDLWQTEREGSLQNQFAGILATLSQAYGQAGEHDTAIACARRWLTLDPLNEAAHRTLMQCYDAAGQRLPALRQYDECVRILKKELGVVPEPATRAVYEQILTRKSPPTQPLPAGQPQPGKTAEIRPLAPVVQTALPLAATPFVGREKELQKINDILVRPECRLVSLVGPGGIGKTRIALQAAQQIRDSIATGKERSGLKGQFPDGVFFVSLAEAGTTTVMLKLIAGVVGCPLREEIVTPAGLADNRLRLVHFLLTKKCLLVLDNLEHLPESPGIIVDILAATQGLKIIATTRHRLNILQEWVVELSGMPVPGYREKEGIEAYSSVQLFIEVARRSAGSFSPSPEDIESIGRICQLVDGMPLGIELAATWVRTFTCQEIAEEIESGLDFLYSNSQGIPERHQSLRAAFEYSWRLLPEAERCVVRRLSVFQGGFNREMAARIAGASAPILASLIDRCFLHKSPSGRYELHHVLNQFIREKLAAEKSEEGEALDFHSESFLDYLIETGEQLKLSGQEEALRALDLDLDNIRLGWERAVENRRIDHLLQAAPALLLYLEITSHFPRGREIFSYTAGKFDILVRKWLARISQAEQKNRAPIDPAEEKELAFTALILAANKHYTLFSGGHPQENQEISTHTLDLVNLLPERIEKAYALILLNLGPAGISPEDSLRYIQECIQIFDNEGDTWGEAITRLLLADYYNIGQQENAAARQAYRSSLDRFLSLGNEWGKAVCFNGLGMVAFREQDYSEARSLWLESVSVFNRLNNVWREIESRFHLAEACEKVGDIDQAIACILENITLLRKFGEKRTLAMHLIALARIELTGGQAVPAHQHHQEALELFHQIGDLENAQKLRVL